MGLLARPARKRAPRKLFREDTFRAEPSGPNQQPHSATAVTGPVIQKHLIRLGSFTGYV